MDTVLSTGKIYTLLPSPKPSIKSHFWSVIGQFIRRKMTEIDGKKEDSIS